MKTPCENSALRKHNSNIIIWEYMQLMNDSNLSEDYERRNLAKDSQ